MTKDVPYGKRLMPTIVDEVAAHSPHRAFASIARPDWRQDGWYDITYREIAGGINAMAWWLDERLGPSKSFDTFAYMGPDDLRYCFVILAAIKTKRKLLLADNRMAREGRLALMAETRCSTLLAAEGATAVFDDIRKSRPDIQLLTIPSFDACVDIGRTAAHYPYERDYESGQHDPIVILHTSGTTGHPKAMIQTNRMLGIYDAHRRFDADLREDEKTISSIYSNGQPILSVWPIHWLGGLINTILAPIMWDSLPVLLPLDIARPTPAPILSELLQKVTVHGANMPPSALKELCQTADGLERVKRLDWVCYGGAPLEQEIGDLLATNHVDVYAVYGSTETGVLPLYINRDNPQDWRYFNFHPACGFRMVPQPEDPDLYEMVIDRKKELADFQIAFDLFPDLNVWHMKDFFRRHPDKEKKDLWLYSGRKDDLFKLAYLTKFNGVDVEEIVERHPRVHKALVGGDGRDSPFLLIEMEGTVAASTTHKEQGPGALHSSSVSDEERARALSEIWPIIDLSVNPTVADAIKIHKDKIIIVDRPLKRTGKETVARQPSLLDFKAEIEWLYSPRK